MQAVLLAGGEGTRLRPISAECPKPMVRLFDKPVMEYGVELLAKHGFINISATLQTMPQTITDYFGDGSAWGVKMRYSVEKEPLGTAGGVRAALSRSIDEPVLILSGDAVTDYDLRAALEYHRLKSADATVLLARRDNALEYGLVMLANSGRIERFVEKPSWGQVFTDTVNTGIYILSPAALRLIPKDTKFDFARDLFPLMLLKEMRLFGYLAEGYWCDIGDSRAFLQCARDVLDGRCKLSLPEQGTLPSGVTAARGCYIGKDVCFGRNVQIGAYTSIGSGSILGDNVTLDGGILDGAFMEAGSNCTGAYLGRGAVLREGASVLEGAVVGAGAVIGENAVILEDSRIWPRKEISQNARVSGSVSKGISFRGSVFDGTGYISGLPHVDITPDYCYRLGVSAAQLLRGEIGLSHIGGEAARLCAASLETGICSGGGRAVITDALTPGCAAFTGAANNLRLTVFIEQEGRNITLYFYDEQGIMPPRSLERSIESHILRGDITLVGPDSLKPSRHIAQTAERYIAAAAELPLWAALEFISPLSLTCGGEGAIAEQLRLVLAASGCVFRDGPVLQSDGHTLAATLENGETLSHSQLLGALIYIEAANGANELALPPGSPAFLDDLAARQGVKIYRLDRDLPKARELLIKQPYTRDPVFLAARLAHGLRKLKVTLSELCGSFPNFELKDEEVALKQERGEVMRRLVLEFPKAELSEGLCARTKGGWVRVTPMSNRSALKIIAEGMNTELADEMVEDFKGRIAAIDKAIGN